MHLANYFGYALGFGSAECAELGLPAPELCGFGGPWEIGLILLGVVILFGGKKLPGLARAMGSSITQFKKGLKDDSQVEEIADSSADEESSDEGGSKKEA